MSKNQAHAAIIAECKAKYGRIVHVALKNGQLFVFRPAELDEWEDYQEALKSKRLGVANREICQQLIVHPAKDKDGNPPPELQAGFELAPLLATRITDQLGDLAQEHIEGVVKKE